MSRCLTVQVDPAAVSMAAAIRAADGLPDHFARDLETGGIYWRPRCLEARRAKRRAARTRRDQSPHVVAPNLNRHRFLLAAIACYRRI